MSDSHTKTASSRPHRMGPGGHGGPPGSRPVEKAKNFKGTFVRLVRYLRPQRTKLIVIFFFAIASTIFTIASPKVTGMAMNDVKDAFVARMIINRLEKAQDQGRKALGPLMEIIRKTTDTKASPPAEGIPSGAIDPEELKYIQDFMAIPLLSDATVAAEKEQICRKLYDLSQSMPTNLSAKMAAQLKDKSADTDSGITSAIKFTPEQLESAFENIGETGGTFNFIALGKIMLILLGMYILSALLTFCTQFIMSSVAQKTVAKLREEVNDKLGRLPLKYFDSRTHGEILSRVTNDVDSIANTLQQSITQLITSVIQIIGYIVMMLTISPLLTLIVMITMPFYVLITMRVTKHSQKYFKGQQKYLGELSGHVEEMYSGHAIVKAFGQEKNSVEKFKEINDHLTESAWKANFVSGLMHPLMNFISNLGYVIISVIGGLWMTKNRLNLGDITAFIQYSRSFNMPIIQTANIANIIQSTIACAERVFEILDEEEEIPDNTDATVLSDPRGKVEINNLSFRYLEDKPLIEDLTMKALPGHTIAIVGPTGAGKTTLVNLLMRFYEINGGTISVDGIDIRKLKRNDLRCLYGMVLQDTWLFNGTIKANIAYGRDGATDEEIVRAAEAAHADHFIRTLPDGYDTILNEEASNISQGQKQLLTIARAILSDPVILILDEATSSVDTRTELLIQKAMANLMKGRTNFVIAHRLSTIRDAELILVMNHGSIVEQGTHAELLARNGFYADIYRSQFAGKPEELAS